MKNIVLGSTGIETPQNAFGALPVQRVDLETAKKILRKAYAGGMTFFDTARGYTDSEVKLGAAFDGMREKVFIATKTGAKTPEAFWKDLETSLTNLRTDYIDLYQFHNPPTVFLPGDGTGMYECMLEAKAQGKIRHIGITNHKLPNAKIAIESGCYETLQFPFSYLSTDNEKELPKLCKEHNMGFIAMKGLGGGLITNSKAAMAYMTQFDNVLPIWGVQRESELEEWLSYMDETPQMEGEIAAYIENEKKELAGDFCRGCGYCLPCPAGIQINNMARMALLLRRAPSAEWLSEKNQAEMMKIENCIHCNNCKNHCPYELDTPSLLQRNLDFYKKVLAGEIKVQ